MNATLQLINEVQEQPDQAMQTNLQLLPLIMNNIPQAVFWKDRNLVYLGCNQAFADDAGLPSPEDVVGKTDFDMPWKEQADLYRVDDWRVLESGEPKLNYEEPQTTPNGSTIWLSTTKIPVRENGQVVAVLGMYEDITARKQTEAAIQAEHQRFQTILETIRVPTIISRLSDGIVLYANQAIAHVSRVQLDKLIGFKTSNFYANPDDRVKVLETLRGIGYIDDFETQFRRTDGSLYWALLSSRIIDYQNEKCVLSSYVDITERKQAEQALRESQQLLRLVMDNIPQAVFWKDKSLTYLGTNRAFAEDADFSSPAEIVGRTDFDMPWRDQADLYRADDRRVLDSGEGKLNYEEPQTGPTGATTWLRTSKIPMRGADGEIFAVLGMYEDITAHKQAEQARQESRRLLQLVMDNIPQAVFWKDQNLTYLGTNQAFAEDAGFSSPADIVGKTDFDMPWQAQAELYRADDQRVLDSGHGKLNYEEPQTGPTGATTWLRTSKIPMRDSDGKVFAVLGMYEDITEWKRLQQQVQEAFEHRGHQVQVSTEISQEIAAASELTELFDRVVTLTKERLGYYHTQLFRYDSAQDAVLLISGYGETGAKMLAQGHRMSMGVGLIGTAAATGQTVMRPVLAQDPDWRSNPFLPETRGEIAVPIKLRDQVLGVLDVQSDRAGAITDDDRLLLEGLCGQIAIAIEQTRLHQEMTARLEEINRLNRAMSHEGWRAYRETADIPDGFMFDQGRLEPVKDTGLASELFANVALTVPGGNVIGTLAVVDDPQHPFTPEDQIFLQQIADQVASALESARLFEQTQSALSDSKEAQELIRKVIDSTDDWIFVKDQDHRYQLVNQGYAKALHIAVEDFIGRNDLDLGFPEELVKGNPDKGIRGFWADDRLVMDGGTPQHYPDDLVMIDGQARVFDTIKIPLRDANSEVWGVLAFARDLTERKQAEEIVAQRATQLEAVAMVSTTASTVLDPDKLLQAVVDLTQQRFGLYHAHIYLADETWQTLLLAAGAGEIGRKMVAEEHAIAIDAQKSLVARAARERQAMIVNDVRSEPGFLPNPLLPETRSEMAVPMIVGDKVLGVFDVQSARQSGFSQEEASIYSTLAAQVGVALQNARLYVEQASTVTQLRELDRLKSAFLANMSHELRTPLNSILGFSDVMLEGLDGELTEMMENDLKLISRNGQHLLSLINDVLDMAKITAGKMNLNVERFNLHEVLADVVNITSPLARDKSLALQLEVPDPLEIDADRTRLRQVMINLVGNAIKFTEAGSVTLSTAQRNGSVQIHVRDTGIGVPPDQAQLIFEEFSQVDTSTTRKTGGTGLGLPISRKLIELHGGQLWVESTGVRGEGSTFIVELPAKEHHA